VPYIGRQREGRWCGLGVIVSSDGGCVDGLQGFSFWMGKEGASHGARGEQEEMVWHSSSMHRRQSEGTTAACYCEVVER
jgi:hypothetical protein